MLIEIACEYSSRGRIHKQSYGNLSRFRNFQSSLLIKRVLCYRNVVLTSYENLRKLAYDRLWIWEVLCSISVNVSHLEKILIKFLSIITLHFQNNILYSQVHTSVTKTLENCVKWFVNLAPGFNFTNIGTVILQIKNLLQ